VELEESLTRNALRMDALSESIDENEDAIGQLAIAMVNAIPAIFGVNDAYRILASTMEQVSRLADGLLETASKAGAATAVAALVAQQEAFSDSVLDAAQREVDGLDAAAKAKVLIAKSELQMQKDIAAERMRLVEQAIGGTFFDAGRRAGKGGRKKGKKGKSVAQTADGFAGGLSAATEGIQSDAVTARLAGINATASAMQRQVDITMHGAEATRLVTLAQLEAEQATRAHNDALAQQSALAGAVTSSFIGMAEGLVVGGDSLKEAGANLLSSFGDIMVQMGTGVVLSSEALLALFDGNPIKGIAAGGALIAGGLLLKSAMASGSKPGGFAASSSSATSFAPNFNDYQKDQKKEESKTFNLFIGQHQVTGAIAESMGDAIRRGQLAEIGGAF